MALWDYRLQGGEGGEREELKTIGREIAWLQRLQHPNILRVLEAWKVEDSPSSREALRVVAITELLPSGSLSEYVSLPLLPRCIVCLKTHSE